MIQLKDIPKQSRPFALSDAYFEQLSARVQNKIETNHLKIESIEKLNSFWIPDNYFEDLNENIWLRIQERKGVFKSIWTKTRAIQAAAAILLISGLFWLSVPKTQKELQTSELATISKHEISTYLADNINYQDYQENFSISTNEADSLLTSPIDAHRLDILEEIDQELLEDI